MVNDYESRGFYAPVRDCKNSMLPWSDIETVNQRLGRLRAEIAEGRGPRIREGDSWALAWHYVSAVLPDVKISEVALVRDDFRVGWLEAAIKKIAASRGVDPAPLLNRMDKNPITEENDDE